MRYELLFQAKVPGAPYDDAGVTKSLGERGVVPGAYGMGDWKLSHGVVEVGPVKESGLTVATVIKVPFSEKTELVREVVREALAMAQANELQLVDPQLQAGLTLASEANVADSFLRAAAYAGQYGGVGEAVGVAFGTTEDEGMPASTKLLLGIVAFVVSLMVALRLF